MLDSLLFDAVLVVLWLCALAASVVGHRYPSAAGLFGSHIEPLLLRIGNELWIATALLWSGFFLSRLADRGVGPTPRGLLAVGMLCSLAGIALLGWVGLQWFCNR